MFLSRLIWMGSAAACALVVSSASAQPGAQPADEPATAQDESDQPTASNDANEIVVTALRRSQGSVAKIVKLEHAWRRLDGRNDDGFQVAPFPG